MSPSSQADDPQVVRHGDAAKPHYSVRYLPGDGESVTIEFGMELQDGREPDREAVIEQARKILGRTASVSDRRRNATTASPSAGLSRPVSQTEDAIHTSEGRDTGTA